MNGRNKDVKSDGSVVDETEKTKKPHWFTVRFLGLSFWVFLILKCFRFMLAKLCINFLFLCEKSLGESNATKICAMTEDCFEQKNEGMHIHGWCANFKINQERVCLANLKYRVMFTHINKFKDHWTGSIEEETSCACFMCKFFS